MGNTLDGQTVLLYGLQRDINRYPVMILGQSPSGLALPVQVDASGNIVVDATVTPGGTQDVNLTKVGGTTFALGQALAAASLPIVLTAIQAAALTPPTKAEDSASADGDTGFGLLAVRKATPANTSGSDGDYEFLQMFAGRVWTSNLMDATQLATLSTAANQATQITAEQAIQAALTATRTFVPIAAVAGSTTTIPIGAKDISVLILTGTGTIGGVDLPVNVPYSAAGPTAATIAVVLANPGTARIFYWT